MFLILLPNAFTQSVLQQDVFNGGVTGAGGNFSASGGELMFDLHIEPGSTIRNAYLVAGAEGQPKPTMVKLNNVEFYLSSLTAATSGFYITSPKQTHVHVLNVTSEISPTITTYSLTIPSQDFISQDFFTQYFLIVFYENSLLPKIGASIFLNNKTASAYTSYFLDNLNPINSSSDVAYSIVGQYFCDTINDGSFVLVNSDTIGLIGGEEPNDPIPTCAGVRGHFYYQNNTVFGLSNDTPNNTMSGPDALANINHLIQPNTSNLMVDFYYQSPNSTLGAKSNPIVCLSLAYSTPCQPQNVTVATDTVLCPGETYQLYASGGLRYEWLPQKDLSCYDCATPVFTGDSSQLYTVRIWGSDSCSVVRPVMVGVYEKPKTTNFELFPSECGAATGAINSALLEPFAGNAFSINGGGLQTNGYFANLPSGTHIYSVHNTVGCRFDTVVVIPSYVSVAADFTVQVASNEAPQVISCINQTASADGLRWFVNDVSNPMNNNQFLADTVGLYSIRLEAWKNDPACFDSLTKTISLTASGLTLTTTNLLPLNDAVAGNFSVTLNAAATLTIELYDTNGKVLLKKQNLLLKAGKNTIWNHQELRHLASEQIYYRILWKTADNSGSTQGKVVVVM